MTQLKSEETAPLAVRMALLYQSFKQNGDEQNAAKLKSWYKKLVIDKSIVLAFCGHFSAGKSSLLNKITHSQLLPSSPIPTSGNLVRIKAGTPSVHLETRAGEIVALPDQYPMEKLHDLLKDSDSIKRIDLQIGGALPSGVELFDTPGVDSTDERHHQATNEVLHLADAVFYVTDYNQVLSDVNFNFMKALNQLGKPFYLIVNQIDKHNEKEGSFVSFKEHVEDALDNWNLHPEKVFYLSLTDEHHCGNDLQAFLDFLNELMEGKVVSGHEDLPQGLRALTGDHRAFLKNQFEQYLEEKHLRQLPDNETLQELDEELKALRAEIAHLDEQRDSWLQQTTESISKAIRSAILMPFDVREAAHFYVASLDPHFKTGVFTSRKRAEKEREERLKLFLTKYQKQVQTMEWAVKDAITLACRNTGVINESDLSFFIGLSEDELRQILTGPLAGNIETNSAYMLNYTEDVADQTKQKMKKQAINIISTLEHTIRERSDKKLAPLKKQFEEKNEHVQILQAALLKKRDLESADNQLDSILTEELSPFDKVKAVQLSQEIEKKESRRQWLTIDEFRQKYLSPKIREKEIDSEEAIIGKPDQSLEKKEIEFSEADWYRKLTQAAAILRPIESFHDAANYLIQTAERVKQKTFTIALFGAFSAGKSSFANALLGEAILPVSPNPTTAVINHIHRSTDDHPNRSTVVNMKTRQTLIDEINHSLALFDRNINDLSELKPLLPHLEATCSDTKGHQHISLLENLADAIEPFNKKWGETFECSLPEAYKMVANEKIACLIESVTMYYDCPFTEQGNVLVDTPGASSIYARHTEVAFHYIKNADAIFFLTYFNHAFSRSDREFLIQLGRVKDTFSLDKMFFIINAIDLARTEQEKQDVIDYIESQLLTFGIRHPKLYGISSKLALREQQSEGLSPGRPASGLKMFLEDWHAYAGQKLQMQVIQSGLRTIQRSEQQIQRWLDDLQLEGDAKENRIRTLIKLKNDVGQSIKHLPIKQKEPDIRQHIDEWFFYIKKRLIQRYIDEFSQFFNPSLFFGQTRSSKEILYQGLKDCIEFLSFDLDQECRVAFLRIESLLKKEWHKTFETCERISAELTGSAGIAVSEPKFDHPALPRHLKEIDINPFTSVFKFYKSSKQFFEKDGRELMLNSLQELLEPHLTAIIERNNEDAKSYYLPLFYDEVTKLTEAFTKQTDQIADYNIKMLQEDQKPVIATLKQAYKELINLTVE